MGAYLVQRLHVSTSDREVVEYLYSQMKEEARTDPAKRDLRKATYRDGLAAHHRAQEQFAYFRF